MRDFGLGKHSIDERIQDEAGVLVEQFRRQNGRPFDPKADLIKAVSNIICSITFGKRLVIWQGIDQNVKFVFTCIHYSIAVREIRMKLFCSSVTFRDYESLSKPNL